MDIGTGFDHLVVQVDNLAETIEALSQAGLSPGAVERRAGHVGAGSPRSIHPQVVSEIR